MRKWLIGFAVAAMVLSVAVVASAATAPEAPETATIDDCMDKMAAVEFPHKTHWELTSAVSGKWSANTWAIRW